MNQILKGIILGLVIAVIIFTGYLFREDILSMFRPNAVRTVDDFLIAVKSEDTESITKLVSLIDTDFMLMLTEHSHYKIDQWEIYKTEIKPDNESITIVYVKGKTKNAFGLELLRSPVFLVDSKNIIVDSKGYFAFDRYSDFSSSDLEVNKLLKDLKSLVTVEDWSWRSDYSYYSKGRVEGKGTVINKSAVAVSYVKAKITYFDSNGNVVNTDYTYVVDSDDLLPGQRRVFEWSTYNCENAKKASIVLEF